MRRFGLRCLCLVALLSRDLANCTIIDDEEPRRTFPTRRAIDGTRGRKYYDPEEDNPYDAYGSSNGRYDPYEEETDLADIRNNVPGEPGVDYPAYTRLPQTEFVCEAEFRGYYADEGAGCQVFHVCDGSFVVSSFLCPIGSIFSQKLLTCDWWNKVDCSLTRNYHAANSKSLVSEVDDDEILRRAFEMARVQPAGERIPAETVSQQQQQERHHDRTQHQRIFTYGGAISDRGNDLPTGREAYSDYSDYPTRLSSRYKSRGNEQSYRQDDRYSDARDDDANPPISVHSHGESRKNEHNRQGSYRNEFQPSYAPTVPTVATTARRFYSPTVPTTNRPPTTSTGSRETYARYDLQFEGSDHLYTAHGRSDDTARLVTPSSNPTKDEPRPDQAAPIGTPLEEDYDKIQGSASFINVESPIEATTIRNFTGLASTSETAAALDHKERALREDLDRLTRKITETLSVLTIDEASRDPNVFSHGRDESGRTPDESDVEELPVANSTIDASPTSPRQDAEPAHLLEPPSENPSDFRIMIIDRDSAPSTENASDATASSGRNSAPQGAPPIRATAINATKLSLSGDPKDQRDSPVFRIVVNNATADKRDFPKIIIEQVKSIDASPRTNRTNFTETRIISRIDEDESNIGESTSGSSPPTSTTLESVHATREATLKSEAPTDVTREATTADVSNAATRRIPEATTIAPSEDDESPRAIPHEDILSRKIDDEIELASSPVQFTLTVNKSEEIDPSGDEIRKLIEQREIGDSIGAADFKNFEIVRSDEPRSSSLVDSRSPRFNYNVAESSKTGRANIVSRTENESTEIVPSNGLRSANYLRSIVALVNGPNSPRPFAQSVDTETASNGDEVRTNAPSRASKNVVAPQSTRAPFQRSTETILSASEESHVEKSLETLEAFPSGLPRNLKVHRAVSEQSRKILDDSERTKNVEELIFALPDARRLVNFDTGVPLDIADPFDPRRAKDERDSGTNGTRERMNEARVESVVQTEFIPSLSFSLNTDEERETYMDAVVKGLLHDVRATEMMMDANKTTTAES